MHFYKFTLCLIYLEILCHWLQYDWTHLPMSHLGYCNAIALLWVNMLILCIFFRKKPAYAR